MEIHHAVPYVISAEVGSRFSVYYALQGLIITQIDYSLQLKQQRSSENFQIYWGFFKISEIRIDSTVTKVCQPCLFTFVTKQVTWQGRLHTTAWYDFETRCTKLNVPSLIMLIFCLFVCFGTDSRQLVGFAKTLFFPTKYITIQIQKLQILNQMWWNDVGATLLEHHVLIGFDISCRLSPNNFHEVSKPVFWEK